MPPTRRTVDAHVLLEIGHARAHRLERHTARQPGPPYARFDGSEPRNVGFMRDEHLAHETEAARLAENRQPRAGRMIDVDDERQLSQTGAALHGGHFLNLSRLSR